MANPALRKLVKMTGCKYTLVIAAAKRARQIVSRKESNLLVTHKPVTIALDEILEGSVEVRRVSSKASVSE
ncbi:MAG TPA: DNA-directed RNA polymerase subunit omega [Firmicutes bacterium]|nr:DNA-directed RNA polymerase subunit omega [Bacillota bacterium]